MKNLLIILLFFFTFEGVQAFTVISNGGKPAKWPGDEVEYEYHNVPTAFKKAINASFEAWEVISGVNLSFRALSSSGEPSSRDDRNSISWVNDGWSQLSFRPPSNALAVTLSSFNSSTGAIIDADIYFNAETFDWAIVESEDDFDKVDVQNIATHEIGHMIGLDHSSVSFFETDPDLYEATMFYASGEGETSRRIPGTDDEKGARSLYPSNPTATPTIKSVQEIESEGSIRVYRVEGTNFNELTSFVLTASDSFSYDAVSRYRTIISSTEAEVELNVAGFYSSEYDLVVFNHPSELNSYAVNVKTGQVNANSNRSGGGGGCSLASGPVSIDVVWIFALVLLFLAVRPRRFC